LEEEDRLFTERTASAQFEPDSPKDTLECVRIGYELFVVFIETFRVHLSASSIGNLLDFCGSPCGREKIDVRGQKQRPRQGISPPPSEKGSSEKKRSGKKCRA